MRALVMAAGLGTRLRPVTDNTPKPLVPVNGRPMVAYVLDQLRAHGVREALINIHYLPEKMRAFVRAWNESGSLPKLTVQDESALILGSGGAVALAASWLFEKDETALVCNSDTIAEPDLSALLKAHKGSGAECTLSLVADPGAGSKYTGVRLLGDKIVSFEKPGAHDPSLLHFFGYYAINASAAKRLPPAGAVSSVMEAVWKPLVEERKLGGWVYKGEYLDVGSLADLEEAERRFTAKGR